MESTYQFSDYHGGDVNPQKEENSSQKILTEGRNFDSNFEVLASWHRMKQESNMFTLAHELPFTNSQINGFFQSQCAFQRRDLNKNPLPHASFFFPFCSPPKKFMSSPIIPKESENTEICLQSFTRTE